MGIMITSCKYDSEANAAYLDLSPNRTKYAGIAVRQEMWELADPTLKVGENDDMIVKTIIVDFDSNGRVLGLELLPF